MSPYWYINNKLPSIFKKNISDKLRKAKENIDLTMKNIRQAFQSDVDYLFPEGIYNWYRSLSKETQNRIYRNGEENFLSICKKSQSSYDIDEIISYIIGLKLEYWNEKNTPALFYKGLKSVKKAIENKSKNTSREGIKILFLKHGKRTDRDVKESHYKDIRKS